MKKGFTLIELLAVIVILAIIAVIATPIVLNIINDTKENATLRSADFYLDAVELSVATSTLKGQNINSGEYNILETGNICLKYKTDNITCEEELKVEVNGDTPKSGTITVTNGNISQVNLILNDKTIVKDEKGTLVYLKPVCTIERQNQGQFTKRDKITCGTEVFYLLDNNDNEIRMIAEKNINVTGTGDVKQMDNAGEVPFVKQTCTDEYTCNPIIYWNTPVDFNGSVSAFVFNENSPLYPYLIDYKEYLSSNIKLNISDISILSHEEIENYIDYEIPVDEDGHQNGAPIIFGPEWLFKEWSWLGSIYDYSITGGLSFVGEDSNGFIIYGFNWEPAFVDGRPTSGVRPLVTISKNNIQ